MFIQVYLVCFDPPLGRRALHANARIILPYLDSACSLHQAKVMFVWLAGEEVRRSLAPAGDHRRGLQPQRALFSPHMVYN
jgi:hypothetical protein